jgi:hypothetical protein
MIMIKHTYFQSILLSCLLTASAQAAMADVFKCVDETGSITFTDIRCKVEDDAIRSDTPVDSMPSKEQVISPAGKFVSAKYSHSAAKAAMSHSMSTDVATMKAAKEATVSMDRVAALSAHLTFSRSY